MRKKPQNTMGRRLHGPQSWYGCGDKEETTYTQENVDTHPCLE
jgi:hypothetical protein